MYALNLADDGRVLSACVVLPKGVYTNMTIVDTLPDGDLYEYRYENGEFVHDPLPKPEKPEAEPTAEEILNVILGVAE